MRSRPDPGASRSIQVDNGTEFTSVAMDRWAYWNGVTLDFSRPGKPQDNALTEAFHSRFRRECLDEHWLLSVADAQEEVEAWRKHYNAERPHSSLRYRPPAPEAVLPRGQRLESTALAVGGLTWRVVTPRGEGHRFISNKQAPDYISSITRDNEKTGVDRLRAASQSPDKHRQCHGAGVASGRAVLGAIIGRGVH